MKREVKIFSLIMSVTIIVTLCGCNNVDGNDGLSSELTSTVPQSAVSDIPVSSESEVISVPASVPQTSLEETPSKPKPVTSTPVVTPPQAPSLPPDTSGNFEVNDPENTRGLSNERFGYSFGAAANGQPHSISVNNQHQFDAYQNVNALALDTVSNDRRMYLTFDCGYEYNDLTAKILDTLKEKNVKAAFFCTLDYLEDEPHYVRRMIDEGHIVGNHSTTHPDFTKGLTRTQMSKELYTVHKYLQDNFNYNAKYFRFPTGAFSENALELVTSVGYSSVFWSIAHADWDTKNQPSEEKTFNTVSGRFHSGAVILLHAVSNSNTNALGRLIDEAHRQGYTFTTLDQYPWE